MSIRPVPGRYYFDLNWPGGVEMDISLREGNDNAGLIEKLGDMVTYVAQDNPVVSLRI